MIYLLNMVIFQCANSSNKPEGVFQSYRRHFFIPQQRKLMGSSAQNSSGVHWCRRRVRVNEVPKVPEKVWEALVQSQATFNRVPEKVLEKVPEKVWVAPGQVQQGSGEGFGEGFGAGSGEGLGGFGAEPGQVKQGSGEGLEGFGAAPGQVQQGSGEGSGEGSRKPYSLIVLKYLP